jgi:hypothetical protein
MLGKILLFPVVFVVFPCARFLDRNSHEMGN